MTVLEYMKQNPRDYYYMQDEKYDMISLSFYNMFADNFREDYEEEYGEVSDEYFKFCEKVLSLVETDGKTKAWETTNPNLQGEFYIIVNWSEFILKNKTVLLEFAEKHWGTFNLQLIQTDHSFVMEWLSELDKYLGNDIINQNFYRSAWELAQKME